ncbi:anthranilate synthase component II [Colletotrichum tofieldiae]|uniref:Anthranilate synthase component II n=1 Tax=Colletotrichum tofieldiae TaxID=708197 RepID=A0A166NW52_9PEZI|nr:anthranilate synthase component II [Colletotrichum tofieldiae]
MVRAIFKNLVIAAAGAFPDDCPSEQAAKDWAKLRQGRFSTDLDDSVTHLICTDEEFKDKQRNRRSTLALYGRTPICFQDMAGLIIIMSLCLERANHHLSSLVKQAERGKRKIHIVSWDWYRFSCTHNKKLREKNYDFSAMRAKEKERFRKQHELERRARNSMIGETWVNPDLYHICTDKSFFEYKIDLFRTSEDEYGALHEKYELCLFESHAKPHLYWFGVKLFHKKDSGKWYARGIERTSPTPGNLKHEFQQFVKFFELKTSVRWWDRVIKAGTLEKVFFNYSPPTRGKPVGGSMKGDLYDKCLRSNKSRLRRWADLFDDELPADLQIEDAAKDILENIIDEVCAFLEANSLLGDEASNKLSIEAAKPIIKSSADGEDWDELHDTTIIKKPH